MTNGRTEKDIAPTLSSGKPMERLLAALVEALPAFDRKLFDTAVAEVKEHPRASLHHLFERFGAGDPAVQAMVNRLLVVVGGPDVVDNLNAVVFDFERDAAAKVLANDLLRQLGQPVDPEVFAMSVPDPEPFRRLQPRDILDRLGRGETSAAIEGARSLHPAERAIAITDALREQPAQALPFVTTLAQDSDANAVAVASAVGAERYEPGMSLLRELQNSENRTLQKLVKRILFDLREEGVAPPERKPEPAPVREAAREPARDELPLHRALMSAPSASGLVLVVVSRTRPDGRLKVFSVLVSLYKRGIQQAALRLSMSRSSLDRFVRDQAGGKLVLKDTPIEECRRVVARGMCVARELDAPLPFDFGAGKDLLGDVDAAAAEIVHPFLCSACGKPLEADLVEKIRAAAAYETIPVETRCAACLGA